MPEAPKYLAIAADLRSDVLSGQYEPGAKLPGEGEIVDRWHVSKVTAGKALHQLIEWGIAEARHGSGTYVRNFRPIVREGVRRLGREAWSAGESVWSAETEGRALVVDSLKVAETEEVPVPVRTLLSLDGPAVVRARRYVLDGKPVMLASSWLPASLAAGTRIAERDTGPGGIYARLYEMDHAPARFREDLRSVMPGPETAERLRLSPGTPVIEILRTAYDASGLAVEVNEMTADSSAYVFRYEFDA